MRKQRADENTELLRMALDGCQGSWDIDLGGTEKARGQERERILKTWKRSRAILLPDLFVESPGPDNLWPRGADREFSRFLYGAKERHAFLKAVDGMADETPGVTLDE